MWGNLCTNGVISHDSKNCQVWRAENKYILRYCVLKRLLILSKFADAAYLRKCYFIQKLFLLLGLVKQMKQIG